MKTPTPANGSENRKRKSRPGLELPFFTTRAIQKRASGIVDTVVGIRGQPNFIGAVQD
jgi:hypothetical protein